MFDLTIASASKQSANIDEQQYKIWHNTALDCLNESVDYFNSEDYRTKINWKFEAENRKTGDVVYSRPIDDGKLFCMIIELQTDPAKFIKDIVENINKESDFNQSFEFSQRVTWLDEQSDIVHVVLKDRWIIRGRYLTTARIWRQIGSSIIIAGRDVDCDLITPPKNKTRGFLRFGTVRLTPIDKKPGYCTMEYLASGELKGWFPRKLVDAVMGKFMLWDADTQRQRAKRLQ